MSISLCRTEKQIYRKTIANISKTFLTTASAFAAPDIMIGNGRFNGFVCRPVGIQSFGIDVGAILASIVIKSSGQVTEITYYA